MSRKGILVVLLLTGSTLFAQPRPYTQVMKEVAQTFASLRKNLDGNSAAAAAEDAAKLEQFFKETEAYWAQFKTRDAVDLSKEAQDTFSAVNAKAKENDIKAAQTVYGTAGRICGDCHFSHREDTGSGFIIKP
jgi:cytochrome c556